LQNSNQNTDITILYEDINGNCYKTNNIGTSNIIDDDDESEDDESINSEDERFIDNTQYNTDPAFYKKVDALYVSEKKSEKSNTARIDYRKNPFKNPQLSLSETFRFKYLFNLILRKGVYPYKYFNNWHAYKYTHIPSRHFFYNDLKNQPVNETDYQHAYRVFMEFEMETLLDYTILYLATDIYLLQDLMENYRSMHISHHGLDPAHFVTANSWAMKAALKEEGMQIELLTCPQMHLLFENSIRGGLVQTSSRYAKSNCSECEDYDENKPNSSIVFLDKNNLYGVGLRSKLPIGDFRSCTDLECEQVITNIMNFDVESQKSLFITCDLKYPKSLHDDHSDFPLCPEKRKVIIKI
jgi:hypothetical protein